MAGHLVKTIRAEDTARIVPTLIEPDGTPYTGEFTACVVRHGVRPVAGDYQATEDVDGKPGILVSGLSVGIYDIWAHVDVTPQHLNIPCGQLSVA
ncbi:hypothetical protein [Subtercola sp. YIM 133946]|uniref:hypothetical protein n=1 Tax=Subtercola sp. YIM 133946 TaxID=3118909 RepID=UPI002F95C225